MSQLFFLFRRVLGWQVCPHPGIHLCLAIPAARTVNPSHPRDYMPNCAQVVHGLCTVCDTLETQCFNALTRLPVTADTGTAKGVARAVRENEKAAPNRERPSSGGSERALVQVSRAGCVHVRFGGRDP